MLIGVQTGQICGFITPPGASNSLEHNLARASLAKRTMACIILSCHSVFCSGGGGALLFSHSSRSKGRQPCQHTSAKHTEFISDARRGGQINKYRSQTQRSGCRGSTGVVVSVVPKSWKAKASTTKSGQCCTTFSSLSL